MTCVDSRDWNGADSATEKGEGPKPLRKRREGYRTNEHGEGGDCWVSRLKLRRRALNANDPTNAFAGENVGLQCKGRPGRSNDRTNAYAGENVGLQCKGRPGRSNDRTNAYAGENVGLQCKGRSGRSNDRTNAYAVKVSDFFPLT